jgi:hypothetical protein
VQLGTTQERLKAVGVETLAIINTAAERARLYFRYRPTRVPLAADPDASTHQAFGLPAIELSGDAGAGGASEWPYRATQAQLMAVPVNPTGELLEPKNIFEAMGILNQKDGFEPAPADEQIAAAHGTQLAGHFLIDRDGVVRWAHVEAKERIADLSRFPGDEEILAAARTLGH